MAAGRFLPLNGTAQHLAPRRSSLILFAVLFLTGCGGGVTNVTPPPPPPGGNPAIGEPHQYTGGTIVLRQQATRAYFVAVNQVETTTLGSYSLAAVGTAAVTGRRPSVDADVMGNEWRLVETMNRVADRLPIPPRPWAAVIRPASVGSERSFWVCVSDRCRWADGGQAQITATLQAIGSRSLIYVDNRDLATIPISRAELIRNVFDGEIWPRVTAVFGKPINPYNPAPGDGPTIILFTRSVREYGWSGYFRAIDLFSDSDAQRWGYRSNEASMFYMAHDMIDRVIHGVNAHEFQHLINYSQKRFVYGATTSESTWINEGLSQIAKDIAGHGYQTNTQQWQASEFFANADLVSFHNWGHADAPIGAYYGGGWLIFRYFADRFGNAALTNLVQTALVGVPNVERVTGEPIGRTLVYNGIAMLVSTEGLGITDPRWTYQSLSLATIGKISYGAIGAKTIRSLGFNFLAVSSEGQPAINVTVTAGSSTPYVGLVR